MDYPREQQGGAIPPIFVIGTGRCGSTMVSNMLRQHPEVLSLSEFFTFITDLWNRLPQAFPEGIVDTAQFWGILSTRYPRQNLMMRHGVAIDEVLYPHASPLSRFNAETGVPAILQTTLPHLTSDCDALFDEAEQFVATLPPARIEDHYVQFFRWLQNRFQRRVWIERSGSSLRGITWLIQYFPQAKFIHMVREGQDCALSMSRHYGFRMALIATLLLGEMGCDPYEDADRSNCRDLPSELSCFLPEHFDAEAFRNYELSPSLYGHFWSGELKRCLPALAQLPEECVLTLAFEDFIADPERLVRELITFVHPTLLDEAWVRQAASLVRPTRSSWRTLPLVEQELLQGVCQPGFAALAAFHDRFWRSSSEMATVPLK